MLFFSVKQVLRLRQAIFGRREPHALACGVAAGFCWGLIPHGNLIAVALLLVIFSLRVNHGMAALVALVTTLLAGKLDPVSHALGYRLLTAPGLADFWTVAWGMPLVPWTDINNTVVLGSFVIAMASLLPSYLLAYPIFRHLAPRTASEPIVEEVVLATETGLVEDARFDVSTAKPAAATKLKANPAGDSVEESDSDPTSPDVTVAAGQVGHLPPWSPLVATEQWIDTRIEVVRLRPVSQAGLRPAELSVEVAANEADASDCDSQADTAIKSSETTEITTPGSTTMTAEPTTTIIGTAPTNAAAGMPEFRTGGQPPAAPEAAVGVASAAAGSPADRPAVPQESIRSDNRAGSEAKGRDALSQPAVIRERPKTQTLNYLLRQLRDSNEGRAA